MQGDAGIVWEHDAGERSVEALPGKNVKKGRIKHFRDATPSLVFANVG